MRTTQTLVSPPRLNPPWLLVLLLVLLLVVLVVLVLGLVVVVLVVVLVVGPRGWHHPLRPQLCLRPQRAPRRQCTGATATRQTRLVRRPPRRCGLLLRPLRLHSRKPRERCDGRTSCAPLRASL